MDSGYFDIRSNLGDISGKIADDLTEEELADMESLINQNCIAEVEITTVTKPGSNPMKSYRLLKISQQPTPQ